MDSNKIIYKYFFNDKTKSLYTGLLEKETDTISVKKFIDCDQRKFRQFFKDGTPLLQFLHDKFVDHDYVRETLEWASSESCCTVVTDNYLSELFRDIRKDVDPCRIKHPINKELVTEREFVLRYIGDARLKEIKNKLMSKYCAVATDCIVPKSRSNIFLYFESKLDYSKGESVFREKRQNRKFFYHVMTVLCPLLTVCKVDSGPYIQYDVLQQFYSIGDPCSDTQALFRNKDSTVSTPFEVLCRTSKTDKEELKVKVWSYSGKSTTLFRTPATNVMLTKIGVKSSFPRSLKNKWGIPIRRKYDGQKEHQVPLVILKCESGYAILDETICKVLYKCRTETRLTAICTRLAPYVRIRYVGDKQEIYEMLNIKSHKGDMSLAVLNILTYVADNWSEERKTMFNNQALVTLLNKKTSCFDRVTAYDFSKFYPTIVSQFKVDQFLSDLLEMMIAFQYVSPLVKTDLVTLIGKSVFFDKFLFHSTKALGVAIMYDVIDSNPDLDIIGCSTDGYFVNENSDKVSDFPKINKATALGIELPIKRENEFSKLIFLGSVTKYMGIDLLTAATIVKGYCNLRNKTHAEVKLMETIATHAIKSRTVTPAQFINSFKQSFESDTSSLTNFAVRDFVYRTPLKESNVKWKTHPEVYYQNMLMQDIDLVYYDKQTLKKTLGGDLEPPLGQHTQDDNCCTCIYCMAIRSADRLGDKIHVSVCHKINVEMYKHNFFQLSSRMLNDIIQYMIDKEESAEEEEDQDQDDTISLYVSVQTKINDIIDNVLTINGMACVGGLLEKA